MLQFPRSNNSSGGSVVSLPYSWMDQRTEVVQDVSQQTLIGVSAWAQDARSILQAHAAHERPLVLIGERGTGRRFLARQLHSLSRRSRQPFIAVECQTLSAASLQAALLGLSATGSRAQGLLELARGGTLYLSELRTWPDELSSLLAQLDTTHTLVSTNPSFSPLSSRPNPEQDLRTQYDVRLVFGLLPGDEKSADHLTFADRLDVPPLRERSSDIELLAEHFLAEFLQTLGREPRPLSPEVRRKLFDYEWPGNIKELKTAMLYAVHHIRTAPLGLTDFPPPFGHSDPASPPTSLDETMNQSISLQEAVEAYEKQLIVEALKRTGGHQTRAAQLLGIKLTTLNMKLSRFGIDPRTLRFQ